MEKISGLKKHKIFYFEGICKWNKNVGKVFKWLWECSERKTLSFHFFSWVNTWCKTCFRKFGEQKKKYIIWMLFILTSIWVLRAPNTGWNKLFQCFLYKKLKKEEKARNCKQNLAKKVFWSLYQNVGQGFIDRIKHVFRYKKDINIAILDTFPC